MPITRRHFFQTTGLAGVGAVTFPHLGRPVLARESAPGQKPRRIIMLVSDGMSMGTMTCADYLSQRVRKKGLTWVRLLNAPGVKHGWMNMRALNSIVTDSAAAASSWGSGVRVVNGALNILPDGRHLQTLAHLFGQAGWKRGMVTTTEITHATPAGFAANQPSRDFAEQIALQYRTHEIEVLLGGGRKFFAPNRRSDRVDLLGDFGRAGYHIALNRDQLLKAPADRRLLGLMADGHLPFTVDQMGSRNLQETIPTLAEMTRLALANLRRHEHFLLQVEGGRVDHGCHNCDAAGAFFDQIAFDEAIDVCLAFQEEEPDTLILITTDHGNGNPGLNAMGSQYNDSSRLFANLSRMRMSFPELLARLEKTTNPRQAVELVADATGYQASLDQMAMLLAFVEKRGRTLYSLMNSAMVQLGQLLGNHHGIGWVGNVHTGDYVNLSALGPGSERFQGFIENTDVFDQFLALAGIDFRNPRLPLTDREWTASAGAERLEDYLAPVASHVGEFVV
jgi:alkaline phosphatase